MYGSGKARPSAPPGTTRRSRLAEPDPDVRRLAVANDRDADRLAGLVLLDLGQQLVDRLHPLVLDGDDQVGRVGVQEPANESQAEPLLPDLDRLDAGLLGRAALDQGQDQQALARGVDTG